MQGVNYNQACLEVIFDKIFNLFFHAVTDGIAHNGRCSAGGASSVISNSLLWVRAKLASKQRYSNSL